MKFIIFPRIVLLVLLAVACRAVPAEEPVRLELDASRPGAAISPLLFSHNLELTRRGAWQGLSAEMVANRKFAAAEKGQPRDWIAAGDSVVAIDEHSPFTGRQSVRVEPRQNGGTAAIRQSQTTLAFRKSTTYAIRLWVRTETNPTITATIASGDDKKLLTHDWPLEPGAWRLLTAEFTAPFTSPTNRLEISGTGAGPFWIGAVSVQPKDAFHGLRRDVIELLRQIKPGSLRYPGGCYAEFYHWRDGLLPVDQRPLIGVTNPSFLLPNTDGFDTQEIGIDEYIALCKEIGCEPAITVRLSENTPDDAAAWVEYCNGPPDSKWGKVRAARGHPAPYGVKCWFVGNELYFFGRGGLNNPEACARQTLAFATAMRAVDPAIRLVGCTQAGGAWNKVLLGQAGGLLDLCSVHDYLLDHFKGGLAGLARASTEVLAPALRTARANLRTEFPAARPFALSLDEWNTMWGRPGSVGMALYAAGVLNFFIRDAETLNLERAYYFMPVNEGAIQVTPLDARLDTAGEVFALYRVHQGNRLVKTADTPPDADLDVCASASPDGRRIYVTALNRNLTAPRNLTLEPRNFAGLPECAVQFLIPEALEENAREFRQVSARPGMSAEKPVPLTIPPGAIARVRFGSPGPLE